MNKLLWIILPIVLLVFAVGCSSLKPAAVLNSMIPSDSYTLNTYTYGSGQRQSLDVYQPKQATNKPPIVFVYGGAWKQGDKRDYEFVAHALTGLGHTVIVPNYRLYPAVRFPAFVNDVADAIRYTETNATRVLGKPMNTFILMGHSSGAHTAALLATDRSYLNQRGVRARSVGLIAMAGPYDLPLNDAEVKPIFAGATAQKAKPTANVYAGMPPTLLLHGQADTRVLPFHTQRFTQALQNAGNPVTTRFYPGIDHVRIVASLAAPLRRLSSSYNDVQAFLSRY